MPKRFARTLRHYAFGLLMGSADVVPGVSGGTVALIVGIYARLIDSIGHGASALGRIARLDFATTRSHLTAIEWSLVLPLGAGIVSAILVASAVIPDLIEEYPAQMRALFLGLIAASIVIPWRRIEQHTWRTVGVLVLFAVAAFIFAGLPDNEVTAPQLWQVYLAASIAICAMILPGVSGAFLLVVMGLYEPTLNALRERDVVYVAVFMAGAVTGISAFSTLLRWLLAHWHDLTMAALVGLMLGSLRALWPFQADDRSLRTPVEGDPVVAVVILGLLGLAVVLAMVVVGVRNGTEAGDTSVPTR